MKTWLIAIITLATAIRTTASTAAPDTTRPEPSATSCPSTTDTQPSTGGESRYDTNFIGVVDCWKKSDAATQPSYINDLYAQWVVERVPPSAGFSVDYRRQRRSPIVRLFAGESRSFVVTAKVHLKDPDSDFTFPVAAVSYEGKVGHGETFVTHFTLSDRGNDFFRMTPTTAATITLTASQTRDADIKIASTVLSTLGDALKIVAPHGALLTRLNTDQNQKIASVYDSTLSSLLSNAVDEEVSIGRLADQWSSDSKIFFSVDLDPIRGVPTPPSHRLWYAIRMSCPRLSIFDSRTVCEGRAEGDEVPNVDTSGLWSSWFQNQLSTLHLRVTPEQVLDFKLATNKTLREYVASQPWYNAFLLLANGSTDKVRVKAAAADAVAPAPAAVSATSSGSSANSITSVASGSTTVVPNASEASGQKTDTADTRQTDPDLRLLNNKRSELCALIVNELYQQGLSSIDARIGLWAVVTGISDFAAVRDGFNGVEGCVERLPLPTNWTYAQKKTSENKKPGSDRQKHRRGRA